MVCTAGRGWVRLGAAGLTGHSAYLRCCRGGILKSHAPVVSPKHGRTPKHPQYGRPSPPCRAPFGSRRGETARPPTSGPSKKHARLRFNLRPRGSRQTSKSSTWGDVKGTRPGTLPVRFKTQTYAVFSRALDFAASNRPLLASRTPHLHTFGGYNAPSVHRSRAQARDA